jgi:uncharacterized protein YndB with AHSA1/START domain
MTRASWSIDIAVPRDMVWEWIVEPARYLQWNPDFSEYSVLQHKEEGVGTPYQIVGAKGGGPITLNCVVTEWVENARFLFKGSSGDGTQA